MKVIIVGGGQTGAYIANILLANRCEVTVIENREHIIQKLHEIGTRLCNCTLEQQEVLTI